jgi:transcriptional regulator with PAS, ATPase and Fis domain
MRAMDSQLSIEGVNERVAAKEEEIQRLTRELEDVRNSMESIIQSIGSGIMITQMNDTIIHQAGTIYFSKSDQTFATWR